ncbi:MAG: hypothetical protein ACRDTG_28555 [Pseudonocardiaceae bacterium]
MRLPDRLLRHTIMVEPLLGTGAHGTVYGPATLVRCNYQTGRRLVRTAQGKQVTVSGTAYCQLTEDIPVGSRIIHNGQVSTALVVLPHDGGGLSTPDHLEVIIE